MRKEQWDLLDHFTEDEDWGDPAKMDFGFMMMLDRCRRVAGIPFSISSGFREDDNGVLDSAHEVGKAADIRVSHGHHRFIIVRAALFVGINRIGVYDKHVHLDTWDDAPATHVIWSGKSR